MMIISSVNAEQPFGVYTYPSLDRHEKRFWNNTRFLYEKTQTRTGAGDLECLYDAVDTLAYSMPYYRYYVKADTKILTHMKNVPDDIGIVLFSHFLTQESELLPSGGYTSPVLFLSSLLKKMCPKIVTRTGYDRQDPKGYYDYVMFQYEK